MCLFELDKIGLELNVRAGKRVIATGQAKVWCSEPCGILDCLLLSLLTSLIHFWAVTLCWTAVTGTFVHICVRHYWVLTQGDKHGS